MTAQLFDPQGRALSLGRELGSGGEGAVFEIAGDARHVAKVYHQPISDEKEAKLRAMAALACPQLTALASWPLAVLHNGRSSAIRGIVLPRINQHDEIHKLYSPAQRKISYPDKDWGFLVHTAMNCAAAFHAIHSSSHVIGDVNQGNLLVSQRGTVFLIDCDSFQVSAGDRRFLCDVGVPQFTPPELQGRNFRGLERTANHDAFGLALVIFHLLCMGRHPFAGRYLGTGEMPIERAISEYRYAFSRQAARLSMSPPPHSLAVEQLAPSLAPLFEQAFAAGSDRDGARPTAEAWHRALAAVLGDLKTCSTDRGHKYAAGLSACPWCRLMLGGAPNFFLSVTFRGMSIDMLNVSADTLATWRAVEAVRPPTGRALPAPPVIAPPRGAVPPPAVESAESLTAMVKYVTLGSLASLVLLPLAPAAGYVLAPILLVFALWWLVLFLTSGNRPERLRRRQVLRVRRGQVKHLATTWQNTQSAAHAQYKLVLKELRDARDQLGRLRAAHDAESQKLLSRWWRTRCDAFLQSQFIAQACLPGIGPSRLANLASYGIETAFDVEYNRVLAVPNIGPYVANDLCAWRTGLERQFKLSHRHGVPESERQALLMKYVQLRQQLDLKLRQGPPRLGELEQALDRALKQIATQLDQAHREAAQAQADVLAMTNVPLDDLDA